MEPPVQPSETQEGTQEADGVHSSCYPAFPSTQCFTLCRAGVPRNEPAWSLPWGALGSKQPAVPRALGVLSLPGASQTSRSLALKVELSPPFPERNQAF